VSVLVHIIVTGAGVDIISFFFAMILLKLLLVRLWLEPLIVVPLKIKILFGRIRSSSSSSTNFRLCSSTFGRESAVA